MVKIFKASLYNLADYGNHLKNLNQEDKYSRFGTNMSDAGIDHIIMQMLYNSDDHELWIATDSNNIALGFGHMAWDGKSWELAVSVERTAQRVGVGNKLIKEMLEWAKVHNIDEVYMHCIENNKVIQHLAAKNKLITRERGYGERVAAIELPDPSIIEMNTQMFKEYTKLSEDMTELRLRMINLMFGNTSHHKEK
jgi:GNAT superfamily N-acetyltransferase